MKNLILSISLYLFYASPLFGQLTYGPYIGSKYGDLQEEAIVDFFDTNLGHYYGIQVKKETQNRLYFTAALTLEKIDWIRTFDGHKYLKEIYLKGNAIALSADIGFYLLNTKNLDVGITTGLKAGNIFNNEFDYYPKLPNSILLGPVTTNYGSFDTRLDLCIQVSKFCSLNISPNYSFLISENVRNRVWRNPGASVSILFQVLN